MKKVNIKFQDIMNKEIKEFQVTSITRNQGYLHLYDGENCIKVLDEFYYNVVK